MLGKVRKHTSRLGHRPVRFQFAVTIFSITLPKNCAVADQAILSLCLERGIKSSNTGNCVYSTSDSEVVIPIRERLEMDAVLYKDVRNNRYQNKTMKLVLRELVKKGLLGQYAYQKIGKCELNLHELVQGMGYELSCKKDGMVLFENLKGVTIRFSITAIIDKMDSSSRYLRDNADMSSNSSISDITEVTGLSTSMYGETAQLVPTTIAVFGTTVPNSDNANTVAAPTATINVDVQNGRISEEKSDDEFSEMHEIPLGVPDTSPAEEHSPPDVPTSAGSTDTDASPSVIADALPPLPSENTRAASTREAFDLYDQHLKVKMLLIHRLERSLAHQAAHSAAQVAELKTELAATAAALRKERVARAAIAEVTHKGDDLLAAALSEARDEAARATAERAAVLEELQGLYDERALHREQVAQLRQQQAQEMELSQQAAAVAASASVRRAEAEDEAQQLLDQLITAKMDCANVAMELDAARRSSDMLQRRLALYAKEVRSLQARCLQLAPAALL